MDFHCLLLNGNIPFDGYVTITTNFLIFDGTGKVPAEQLPLPQPVVKPLEASSQAPAPAPAPAVLAESQSASAEQKPAAPSGIPAGKLVTRPLRIALPLRSVASIHRATSVPPEKPGVTPSFAITANKAAADAVLVFTLDGSVHQLYSFTYYMYSHKYFFVSKYATGSIGTRISL